MSSLVQKQSKPFRKRILFKTSFWKRLFYIHPSVRKCALQTAMKEGQFLNEDDELFSAPSGLNTKVSGGYNQHKFWAHAFQHNEDEISSILEIGCFQGATTLFLAKLFPKAEVTCIDPWEGNNGLKDQNEIYEAFERNTSTISNRVETIKGYSSIELPKLMQDQRKFDLIFIDGSHFFGDVSIDSEYSWRLLKANGYIIWDDYFDAKSRHGNQTAKLAIDAFLSAYKGDYKPIWVYRQVAIQKLS